MNRYWTVEEVEANFTTVQEVDDTGTPTHVLMSVEKYHLVLGL